MCPSTLLFPHTSTAAYSTPHRWLILSDRVALDAYQVSMHLCAASLLRCQVEQALGGVSGVRRRQRLRNAAALLFTDWREVWGQVRLGDSTVATHLHVAVDSWRAVAVDPGATISLQAADTGICM
jgi:hypothetical protein